MKVREVLTSLCWHLPLLPPRRHAWDHVPSRDGEGNCSPLITTLKVMRPLSHCFVFNYGCRGGSSRGDALTGKTPHITQHLIPDVLCFSCSSFRLPSWVQRQQIL